MSPTTFHDTETRSGLYAFAVNADGTRIGYVGVMYGGWVQPLMKLAARIFDNVDLKTEKNGKEPFWALPLAFLFSPYTPALHPLMESSRRYFPVNAVYLPDDDGWKVEERVWKKGYLFVSDKFLTPAGELVVTAHVRGHCHVVVDEAEGPAFDEVWNVCHDADGDGIIYVARRGNTLYRVEAKH